MQYMENPSFHHTPEGYWDQENEKRKKHRFVGRKIWYHGKLVECVRATDTQAIFKLTESSELILNGAELENVKWYKERSR
jgi:adenosylmethionine-8-amino-7-oxononanoate aminotransferase